MSAPRAVYLATYNLLGLVNQVFLIPSQSNLDNESSLIYNDKKCDWFYSTTSFPTVCQRLLYELQYSLETGIYKRAGTLILHAYKILDTSLVHRFNRIRLWSVQNYSKVMYRGHKNMRKVLPQCYVLVQNVRKSQLACSLCVLCAALRAES